MRPIVIVGGYGAFGARIAARLARHGDVPIVVAGRSADKASRAAVELQKVSQAPVTHAVIDAANPDVDLLRGLAASVLVNASGPFQALDYALPRAAIQAGLHYVDIADARAFVTGISSLDAEARAADVLVASGASSVPAFAAAIVDDLSKNLSQVESIQHGITPANSYNPGVATTASIIGGVGQPLKVWRNGAWTTAYGWQGLTRHTFPEFGTRWFSACDVPDLEVFPQRYPGVRTVDFKAGLEVGLFHFCLWGLSWPRRMGLLPGLERLAPALLYVKDRLTFLGSDKGGMFVQVTGRRQDNDTVTMKTCHVIARGDDGPYIPGTPALIVARKLARGEIDSRGARPCAGFFDLQDFEREVADLDIDCVIGP